MNDISQQVRALRIDRSRNTPAVTTRRATGWGRRVAIGLGVITAGVVVVAATWLVNEAQVQIAAPSVRIAVVKAASLAESVAEVTASGYVAAERAARVLPKQTGRVSVVFVKQGQVVRAGDKLLELESRESRAALAVTNAKALAAAARAEQARADIVAAQLATEASQLQATRERQLAAAGLSGQAAADDLDAVVRSLGAKTAAAHEAAKVADADAKAARAEVLAVEENIEESTLVAPIDGTIVNKPPEVGDVIGPSTAALGADVRAIEVASLDSLLIEVDVPEQRIALVKQGQSVEIVMDCCSAERLSGRVREVTPFLDRAKATVTVKVAFEQRPPLLLPNMAGRVYFLAQQEPPGRAAVSGGVVVPMSALVASGGKDYVYVLESDSRAKLHEVLVHHRGNGEAVLSPGLAPGAEIVDSPTKDLVDGQVVKRTEN